MGKGRLVCYPHSSLRRRDQRPKAQVLVHRFESTDVGELINPEDGMILVEEGNEKRLEHPVVDLFWKAFYAQGSGGRNLGGCAGDTYLVES